MILKSKTSTTAYIPLRQRGAVLLIALIVLVAMTLAGIAMMRSVDTGILVSGNMAFRQSATLAADAGINSGWKKLQEMEAAPKGMYDQTIWPNAVFPVGYSPTPVYDVCVLTNSCTVAEKEWWNDSANWGYLALAKPQTITVKVSGGDLATVKYLMERMCPTSGAVDDSNNCLKQRVSNTPFSLTYYRITARAEGLRGAASVVQAMVLLP